MARMGKISVKVVCGADLNPPEKGTRWLMDVVGAARAVRTGMSNYGEFNSFFGAFQAQNLETGEVFTGDECFLPGIAEGRVLAFLKQNPDSGVEFAYKIGIKASTRQKYEFVMENLISEAGEVDIIQRLRKDAPLSLAPPSASDEAVEPKKKPVRA